MTDEILEEGKRVLLEESNAITSLSKSLDSDFLNVIDDIYNSGKHVVISGVGKSALIAQKMAATFSSTGTPAIFVHSADAIHGDSGVIQNESVCLILSHSGNSEEIKNFIPVLKNLKCKIVGVTSNKKSFLAKNSNIMLDTLVSHEACSLKLAPTTSTTVCIALGDALAIALMKKRGFSKEDYAKFHLGGMLGKSLLLKVEDLMHKGSSLPKVLQSDKLKKAVVEISEKRLGFSLVVDSDNKLQGIITDGDLRRAIELDVDFSCIVTKDIMTKNPIIIDKDELIINALNIMKNKKITSLVIMNKLIPEGVLTMHDILREGFK